MEENTTENWILDNTNKLSTKISSFLSSLDRTIHKNFKDSGIETRPVKSHGLWCSALIPTILLFYAHTQPVSLPYKSTAYLSIGLLCYSLLFIVFITVSSLVVRTVSFGGCLASSLIASMFLYISGLELYIAVPISATATITYYLLLRFCLNKFPKSFTIGELMITQQSVVLFTFMLVAEVWYGQADEEVRIIEVTLFIGLLCVTSLVLILSAIRKRSRTVEMFNALIIFAVLVGLSVLHVVFGHMYLFMLFELIFKSADRIKLLLSWLCLLLVTVALLIGHTMSNVKATTVTRKPFHVCAALVFISGILCDVKIMGLAAGAMLAVIILMEAIRLLEIKHISRPLQNAFEVYKDEKDCGTLALTPIYLYMGLCCPLVLVPGTIVTNTLGNIVVNNRASLERLAGALAAGLGDSAASWAGSRYGSHMWPGSNRTKEGTIFNILSQIATVYALVSLELLQSNHAVLRTFIAATISALVEAKTEQVDNIILPLVMIMGYQLTFFLAN